MVVQLADTPAGLQVPKPDAVVHGGGEQLRLRAVRVELDEAGRETNQESSFSSRTATQLFLLATCTRSKMASRVEKSQFAQ